MGAKIISKLDSSNIFLDYGEISIDVARALEKKLKVILPSLYVDFITKHNGADPKTDVFDFEKSGSITSDAISFIKIEEIANDIELLQSNNTESDMKDYFEDGLIPFGDNGGGDMICFDYRDNNRTDNPQIVLWKHEIGFREGVSFIASNFEEFINMLYEPDDED